MSKNKTKLISVFSPSHKILMEKYFLPSIKDDLDIQLFEHKNDGNGYYMDSDWVDNVLFKSQAIIKTIKENPGEIFIYSDVDIEFFAPFEKKVLTAIKDLDIVCHLDDGHGTLCTGFFGIRANRITLTLWEEVYKAIEKEHRDQIAFNRIIRTMRDIRFGCLPSNFFGGGTFTSRIISSKNRIYIPHRPVMFHANYTLGIANKIALLEKVRELNKQNEIIVLFNNFSFKSRKKHRRNIKIVGNILLSNQRRIIELDSYSRPRYVCIEASTVCQLNCVSCPTSNKIIHKVFGSGFLSFNDYKHFIEAHPWITKIELSNWGEVFLNPELTKILEFSQQKNILLTIDNGANMNAVPEKVLEALVRCRVQSISCSIDGASEETYSVYRVNGSYNQVIKNIRRLNEYKQQYGCDKPRLKWQFVAFGHNEHEIGTARSLASNLGMQFHLKLSWDDLYINTFSPIANKELIRTESGLGVADRKEFEDKYKRNYVDQCCLFFFLKPHINFDGKLLGCGINHWSDFGNVFHEGMENCIKGERYQYTRQMLMGLRPERKDIPCIHCKIYNFRKTRNNYVTKEQLKNFPF